MSGVQVANSTTYTTLADIVAREKPGGGMQSLIELLEQSNPMLADMPMVAGNMTNGHMTTVRTGLPKPTWQRLYEGIEPSKGETKMVMDTCGRLEALSAFDARLEDYTNDMATLRMQEDKAHVQGIANTLGYAYFYESEKTHAERITGFSPRFNTKNAENGRNVVLADGIGRNDATRSGATAALDLTSIYIVGWSPETVHGIYPKHATNTGGIRVTNLGKQWSENIATNKGAMPVYRTLFEAHAGLCVRDWRYVLRIPNIPLDALKEKPDLDKAASDDKADALANIFLPWKISKALKELPANRQSTRMCMYMNKDVMHFLEQQVAWAKHQGTITTMEVQGQMMDSWKGQIPMKRTDSLNVAENPILAIDNT